MLLFGDEGSSSSTEELSDQATPLDRQVDTMEPILDAHPTSPVDKGMIIVSLLPLMKM